MWPDCDARHYTERTERIGRDKIIRNNRSVQKESGAQTAPKVGLGKVSGGPGDAELWVARIATLGGETKGSSLSLQCATERGYTEWPYLPAVSFAHHKVITFSIVFHLCGQTAICV